jgi:hypothetical protein
MRALTDWDPDALGIEILRIHALMKRYPNFRVIPAHDYSAHEAAALYPEMRPGRRR